MTASAAVGTLSVLVRTMGVSSVPSSWTWVEPVSFPKPLATKIAAGTLSWKMFPSWGRMAVTPVRTSVPSMIVTCPTAMPATSVMALSGPGSRTPVLIPNSRGPRPFLGRRLDGDRGNEGGKDEQREEFHGMLPAPLSYRKVRMCIPRRYSIIGIQHSTNVACTPQPPGAPRFDRRDIIARR